MKSQADMDQLNEKIQYKKKGKAWIRYIEGESSKQGAQKNQTYLQPLW